MVSQADRELISNFVTELLPYVETVDSGVQEFAQPTRDGLVVGQAIQALSMIKGAGSILLVDGLVTLADLMSHAFERVQTNTSLTSVESFQRLTGLKLALDDFLTALESGSDTMPIVTRARTIFESIPTYTGSQPGTPSLADRASLDALFTERVNHAREHSAQLAADRAAISAHDAQVVTAPMRDEDTQEITLPADFDATVPLVAAASASLYPPRVAPEQPTPEPVGDIDPELREIFAEEAAELIVSFGENAKEVAKSPTSIEALAQLRRDAHTLKGAANMTGFAVIGRLAGAVERLLDEHLDTGEPVTRDALELLLVSWKMLRAMLARLDDVAIFHAPTLSTVQRAEQLRELVGARASARYAAEREALGPLADVSEMYQPTPYDHAALRDEPAPVTELLTSETVASEADAIVRDEDVELLDALEYTLADESDLVVEDAFVSPEPEVIIEPLEELRGGTDSLIVVEDLSEAGVDSAMAIVADEHGPADAPAREEELADELLLAAADQVMSDELSAETPGDEFLEELDELLAEESSELPDTYVEHFDEPMEAARWDAPVQPDSDEIADTPRASVDAAEVALSASEHLFMSLPIDPDKDYQPMDVSEVVELLPDWQAFSPDYDPALPGEPPDMDVVDELLGADDLAVFAEPAEHALEDVVVAPADSDLAGVDLANGVKVPLADELASELLEADAAPTLDQATLEPLDGSDLLLQVAPEHVDDHVFAEPFDASSELGNILDAETFNLEPEMGAPVSEADADYLLDEASVERELLSSALLDLAFAAEGAQTSGDSSEQISVTILDRQREGELALELFETFAIECEEQLDALNRAAMQLDREPGAQEPVRQIKHALHTLKGAAAAADLHTLSARCHRLEDELALSEQSGVRPGRDFAGTLFAAAEEIEALVVARRAELRGDHVAADVLLGDLGAAEATSLRVDLARVDGLLNTVGELVVNRAGLEQRLERLSGSLEELALTASRLQITSQLLEREAHSGPMLRHGSLGERRALEASAYVVHERMPGWDALEFDRYTEFDRLIRQLTEVGADITASVNEISQLRGDLDTVSTRERRLTTAMQDELMGIRMVPIASLAPRLYRVVRGVSGERGKEVRLVLEGGDTPFEKTLLDALHEPLSHLLRNAVDHGIETPEERRRAGKSETGTIRIRAYRDGSEAVIDIIDDGAGIDHEQVLARAHEAGLTTEAGQSRADALRLIFHSGFSTRLAVDEVSGRGVGLDIVESVVNRFKGRMTVDSAVGQGTIFSLRMPVLLAVTQAFLVTAGGERFAIPIANIESVADRDDQRFTQFGDAAVMEIGDNAIPVVDLSARMGPQDVPVLERDGGWILSAQVAERRWALYVDDLEGQQEIVVKPLGRFLRNTPSLLGATILGNGDVALIVDVPQLMGVSRPFDDRNVELMGGDAGVAPDAPEVERAKVALVVDDSLSVRRVVGRTLERHGWLTVLARDGVEALELLDAGAADVIVTDIEMPRMDGFELLTSVRARPSIAATPIVILTSRSGEKHRGRAFELGADAYLVKPFQEQELIETVERAARNAPATVAA